MAGAAGGPGVESVAEGAVVCHATAVAPTNIAVVKYWGKRDGRLNLPINSSLSVTLDTADLRTVTSACASRAFSADRVWLNGKEQDVAGNARLQNVFREVRARARDVLDAQGRVVVSAAEWASLRVHVVSENSFPTAAGLASSASGYACLTKALATLMGCAEGVELSDVARMGSGSASRSLFGGFVRWSMGERADGADSLASQVAPLEHWPEMHALICVVSDHKKTVTSTGGMADSVRTSELLQHRASAVVPQRMLAMERAVAARDFAAFAELTIKDSNSFHATCLDTYPPIKYMNDVSHAIAQAIHALNAEHARAVACYTYDAGPNAVLFLLEQDVPLVMDRVLQLFGPATHEEPALAAAEPLFVRGRTQLPRAAAAAKAAPGAAHRGAVRYLIHTRVGPGARVSHDDSVCLLDKLTGMPRASSSAQR